MGHYYQSSNSYIMYKAVKHSITNPTQLERLVKKATNKEKPLPTQYELEVILQHTKNAYTRKEILTILWKRLGDHGKYWQRVHKALIVFEYLVRHGDDRLRDNIRQKQYAIQSLKNFQTTAAYGIARNDIVAEVNVIMDLLSGKTPLDINADKAKRSDFAESFYSS